MNICQRNIGFWATSIRIGMFAVAALGGSKEGAASLN